MVLQTDEFHIKAFESVASYRKQWIYISQRTLINRRDSNLVRLTSRSIGGLPETFRSCWPQMEIPGHAMNACLCVFASMYA